MTRREISGMAGSNILDTAGRKTTKRRRKQTVAKRYMFRVNAKRHSLSVAFQAIAKNFHYRMME